MVGACGGWLMRERKAGLLPEVDCPVSVMIGSRANSTIDIRPAHLQPDEARARPESEE